MKLVAFLDILGFSDLVKNNSLEELSNIYNIFERGYKHAVTFNRFTQTPSGILPDFSDCHIEAIQISDSIIVWTKDDSMRSYFDLIMIVRELLGHGMYSGLPLRACIDYGEFKHGFEIHVAGISTNTFFGKAIMTSYQKCQSQSWSGGFMTKEAIDAYSAINSSEVNKRIRELTNIESLQNRHFIKIFPVPFNSVPQEEYCINWVNWQNPKKTYDNLIKAFNKFNKGTSDPRVQKIIGNTVEFWKLCPDRI